MKRCLMAICLVVTIVNPLHNKVGSEISSVYQETIHETFTRTSKSFDKVTQEIGYEITKAESEFRNVCNTEGCRYGIGPMQIVKSTFKEQCDGDVFNQSDNITCGLIMLERGHYWRWDPSFHKWYPRLSKKAKQKVDINLKFRSTD